MVNTVVGGGGGRGGWGQGGPGGGSTRLPPMWPRFQSWRRRHRWVGGLSLLLALSFTSRRISPGTPVSPPPSPPISLKSNTWQIPIRSSGADLFNHEPGLQPLSEFIEQYAEMVLYSLFYTMYNFFLNCLVCCISMKNSVS